MSTRRYSSPRRARAALATRAAIIDAAERLYVEQGYTATRLTDIAKAAEVSPATIKNAFGTKGRLLQGVVRARVVGDAADTPLTHRDIFTEVLAERHPRRLLERFIALTADVHARSAALIEAVVHAASSDPELAQFARRGADNRYRDIAQVIAAIRKLSPLRDEMPTNRATEILWALSSPSLYQQLVNERGWTAQQWTHFVTHAVEAALLPEQ